MVMEESSVVEFPDKNSNDHCSVLFDDSSTKNSNLSVPLNGNDPVIEENSSLEVLSPPCDGSFQDTDLKLPKCCGIYEHDQFYKGCKWSPDSSANRILTCDGDNRLRIFHTFLNRHDFANSHISGEFYELKNVGKIYDYDWYPLVSSGEYHITVASSLGPVHIWNMTNLKSEASFRMYNTKDEAVHANCVSCSTDGRHLYAATSDYIFLFDVNRPGRTFNYISTRPHFKRAIISTITTNPTRNSMFAVGTYNHRVGIYDDTQLLCVLNGHIKGITHLKFSSNGTQLYSGVRGNGEIICWDLRNPGTALYKLIRTVKTQQRIYFDLTTDDRYVVSGSTNGDVLVWDTLSPPIDDILSPVCVFKAHDDCTNGISFNKNFPIIATVSGQYHDHELSHTLCNSDGEDCNESIPSSKIENSLKLWYAEW